MYAADSKNIVHHPQDSAPAKEWPGFGALFRKCRCKEELSQSELASMMEVTRWTISEWENDRSHPSLDETKDLIQILGIPLYELFGLSDNSVPSKEERFRIM